MNRFLRLLALGFAFIVPAQTHAFSPSIATVCHPDGLGSIVYKNPRAEGVPVGLLPNMETTRTLEERVLSTGDVWHRTRHVSIEDPSLRAEGWMRADELAERCDVAHRAEETGFDGFLLLSENESEAMMSMVLRSEIQQGRVLSLADVLGPRPSSEPEQGSSTNPILIDIRAVLSTSFATSQDDCGGMPTWSGRSPDLAWSSLQVVEMVMDCEDAAYSDAFGVFSEGLSELDGLGVVYDDGAVVSRVRACDDACLDDVVDWIDRFLDHQDFRVERFERLSAMRSDIIAAIRQQQD